MSSSFIPRRHSHLSRDLFGSVSGAVPSAESESEIFLYQHFFGFGDSLGGVQALRANRRTVHDGMAAIELERLSLIHI